MGIKGDAVGQANGLSGFCSRKHNAHEEVCRKVNAGAVTLK